MPAAGWVCLMYHDVLPATDASGGGPERFATPLDSFERMLDLAEEMGLQPCSMGKALSGEVSNPVAITFDDGAVSQYEHAFPALKRRSASATFFVTTDWVGRPGFMTWDQVRELVRSGMSVQSHTKSHPFLSELNEAALRAELEGSKAALDRHLAQDTTELSLPGGDAPRRSLRHLLGEAGYRAVAGSRWGGNDFGQASSNRGFIRRCTVRGDFDRSHALKVLSGDRRLALSRYSREAVLNGVRGLLGASNYARYRRSVLDLVSGPREES